MAVRLKSATEAQVQAGSGQLLSAQRNMVAFWWRPNGGGYKSQHRGGKAGKGWVWCQRGPDGKAFVLPDTMGMLTNGLMFGLEFKAPGKWPSPALFAKWDSMLAQGIKLGEHQARQVRQRDALLRIHRGGGRAGVSESLEDTRRIIMLGDPLGLYET